MKKSNVFLTRDKKYRTLFVLASPLLILGFLGGTGFLFALGLLLYATLLTVHVYLQYIHRPIELEFEWSQRRLFPGEQTTLQLRVVNHGRYGAQGKWYFQLHKKLDIQEVVREEGNIHHKYRSTFALQKQEALTYTFQAQGLQRGVVHLQELSVELHDPFTLGSVKKEYRLPKNDVLIYPELQPIAGIERLQQTPMGERSVNHFTHEDPTYIVGARTYQSGDPFQRIDWKTTARKQDLHTKIVDRTAHTELVIIGNVRSYEERWRGIEEQVIERSISAVASIGYYSTLEEQPYQIVLNMKPLGRKPVYQISRGEGRKHLAHTLECLSRVSIFSTIPFEEALYYAYQDYTEGKIFVLVTPYMSVETQQVVTRMSREGIQVFIINTEKEGFLLQKAGKGLKRHA